MKNYPAILGSFYNTPLCILPAKAEEIAAFLEAKVSGQPYERRVVEEPVGYCMSPGGERVALDKMAAVSAGDSFVAVLPLFGTMYQHGSMEMEYSGGTSTERFGAQFSALDANPAVKTIIVHGHTPGGQVYGTEELSTLINAAAQRGSTRVVTVANSMMASAGLWVGTAANEVFITPGGEMGSLGVVMMHVDVSKAEEKRGVTRTLIATSDKKIEGHPYAPLGAETAAEWLADCQRTLTRFVGSVARNRGLSASKVESDFGKGGMLPAQDAVAAKMADGVATMREVLGAEMDRLKSMAGRGGVRASLNDLVLAENNS